jgi:3-deoxy-7-phosphoheptulonate synthase
MPGVDHVTRISQPYKLASLQFAHDRFSSFEILGREVGPGKFFFIAGPCTVESREQTLEVARAVAAAGASALRGGAYKPRTSPFAFQGLGQEGLDILQEARAQTGLPIVTELTSIRYIDDVAAATDVVQVGARNMQNYSLLQAVGELGKPVLLKRGLSSTCEELLMAADYILKEGNEHVILCERGIRTFDNSPNSLRFTLDLGGVAWLKAHTHLPVIVDPSHASGNRRYVEPLSRAAAAVGADGLIVEVTEDPDAALCDPEQQLYSVNFQEFADAVSAHAHLLGRVLS